MNTKTISESPIPSIRLRTISIFVAAAAAALLPTSKSLGNQLDDMRNAIGRVCPADPVDYSRVDANAECNPNGSKSRGCDQKFAAASAEWQACLAQIQDCRRGVDETNKVINDYNSWMSKCRSGHAEPRPNASSTVVPKGGAVPVDSDSPLARAREAARKKAEGADQKNDAAAAEVTNVYEQKVDELNALKVEQERQQEILRQNREKIQKQIDEEAAGKENDRVTCYNSFQACKSQCMNIRDYPDAYGNYCSHNCRFNAYVQNQSCFPK